MAAQTLNDLALSIGRRYGNAASGTATSGTTTTLVDTTGLYQPDHIWVNHYCRFTSGNNSGQERLITAFDQATATATVSPALPSAVAASDAYRILPLANADIVQSVQEAVRAAGQSWLVVKINDTGEFTGEQEYGLPTDLLALLDVYAGSNSHWAPLTGFEVVGNYGAYKLLLREWPQRDVVQDSDMALADMRLVYVAAPTQLTSGTDSLGLGEDFEREAITFIEEFALHILHEMALSRNATGEAARAHLSMSQGHLQKALNIRQNRRPQRVVHRVRTPNMPRHL